MRTIIAAIEINGGRKRYELAADQTADGLQYEICRMRKNGAGDFVPAGSGLRFGEKNADIIKALVEKIGIERAAP
jgi:hypothetical protein